MGYIDVISLIFSIATILLTIIAVYMVFFFVVGIFKCKKYPKAKEQKKYGIIIPARNEESVVAGLIESVYKNKYPQDKLQIFVIAHNCTDKTAKIARDLGATVYEYNNPKECTMGYAFRYLFDCINRDYGNDFFDGFFLFNADNILKEDYFEKMNDAFCYYNGERIITSYRNSKNFSSNIMSACYGLLFISNCRFESRGRTVCNCSTRVQGTGYVISNKLVKDGWKYVTLTEDWEFSADQVLNNNKIMYCDEAEFFDEQPTSLRVMWRQRVRWAKGHLLVFKSRFALLFKQLFKRNKKGEEKIHKFSIYDIMINISPIRLIGFVLTLIQAICISILPLFYNNYGLEWLSMTVSFVVMLTIRYIVGVAYAGLIFGLEKKRIKCNNPFKKIVAALVWPIFDWFNLPITITALFSRNLKWKTIPHKDTTSFDDLNGEDKQIKKESVVIANRLNDEEVKISQ